jgi:hypothetical protein
VDGVPRREQAAAAFAWVVRHVRLRERAGPPLPVAYVLRRGFGSAAERGLIFLALMEQLGGGPACCLVGRAGAAGADDLKLWACGVPVEGGKNDFLLFDPRLGLPLPATLAEVLANPDVLKPVTVDAKHPYDVDADRVKGSGLYLAMPLSGLAPRMRFVEAKLSEKSETAVRLADPLAALEALEKAGPQAGGKPLPVAVWKAATRTQRGFWPPEEGGADRTLLLVRTTAELLPRDALPTFLDKLPDNVRQSLGQEFQSEFVEPLANYDGPRERMLRGRCDEATRKLVDLRNRYDRDQASLAGGLLQRQVQDWCDEVAKAQLVVSRLKEDPQTAKTASGRASLAEAEAYLDQVVKVGLPSARQLVHGFAARHRLAEATYQLALSLQEAAEQQDQALRQMKQSGRAPSAKELDDSKKAWGYADNWWKDCLQQPSPLTDAAKAEWARITAAAQAQRARVLERLDQREQALTLLRDLSGELTPLEKTARLYLAKQVEKGGP